MGLSTHILDTALGKPAPGVPLILYICTDDHWVEIGRGLTDADGRCRTLLGEHALLKAQYRLRFEISSHFTTQGLASLYPYVEIVFEVHDPGQHFHIPLLVAANGYTTYRGS